ncbi:MAG: right-handed parallel beta-helix repeat-containing protein [Phycisphaerales bacterium]|nr:right-handed parallel beta-helix repeat-containing protein [Phycisphaerales bacterium]
MRVKLGSISVIPILAAVASASSDTWTVDDDGSADFETIQAAIDESSNGDTIEVYPGWYSGTGNQVIDSLGKSITIRASGTPEETIIDGEGQRRVVYCSSGEGANTIIDGFTITGGSAYYGGGIYCYSSPTITDCTISGNTADYGGGISCWDNSNPTITGCTITGNTTGGLGGGLYAAADSLMSIQDTSIRSNVPAESQVFGAFTDNGGNTIAEVCPWYQGACCTGNDLACVVATEEDCEYFGLTWLGEGTTCDDAPCPIACLGDVTGDGEVSTNDLLTVIANWGVCP